MRRRKHKKNSSMDRCRLEEAVFDMLSLSMEYNGEEADIWAEIEATPTDLLVAFLENQ